MIDGFEEFYDLETKERLDTNSFCVTRKLPNGYYQSIIPGSWSVGYGKSRKSSINDAIKSRDKRKELEDAEQSTGDNSNSQTRSDQELQGAFRW